MANCCSKLYVKATRTLVEGLASVVTVIRDFMHAQKAAGMLLFTTTTAVNECLSLRNTISTDRQLVPLFHSLVRGYPDLNLTTYRD